jgi:hypothetical protein
VTYDGFQDDIDDIEIQFEVVPAWSMRTDSRTSSWRRWSWNKGYPKVKYRQGWWQTKEAFEIPGMQSFLRRVAWAVSPRRGSGKNDVVLMTSPRSRLKSVSTGNVFCIPSTVDLNP